MIILTYLQKYSTDLNNFLAVFICNIDGNNSDGNIQQWE